MLDLAPTRSRSVIPDVAFCVGATGAAVAALWLNRPDWLPAVAVIGPAAALAAEKFQRGHRPAVAAPLHHPMDPRD